jgi:hypothetical protein
VLVERPVIVKRPVLVHSVERKIVEHTHEIE